MIYLHFRGWLNRWISQDVIKRVYVADSVSRSLGSDTDFSELSSHLLQYRFKFFLNRIIKDDVMNVTVLEFLNDLTFSNNITKSMF